MSNLTPQETAKNVVALDLMNNVQADIIQHCVNIDQKKIADADFSVGDIAYSVGAATASALFELLREEGQGNKLTAKQLELYKDLASDISRGFTDRVKVLENPPETLNLTHVPPANG